MHSVVERGWSASSVCGCNKDIKQEELTRVFIYISFMMMTTITIISSFLPRLTFFYLRKIFLLAFDRLMSENVSKAKTTVKWRIEVQSSEKLLVHFIRNEIVCASEAF